MRTRMRARRRREPARGARPVREPPSVTSGVARRLLLQQPLGSEAAAVRRGRRSCTGAGGILPGTRTAAAERPTPGRCSRRRQALVRPDRREASRARRAGEAPAVEVARMALEAPESAYTMAAVAREESAATAGGAKEAKTQGHRNSRHGSVSHLFPVLLVFSSEFSSESLSVESKREKEQMNRTIIFIDDDFTLIYKGNRRLYNRHSEATFREQTVMDGSYLRGSGDYRPCTARALESRR